jgi:hypothetical protein
VFQDDDSPISALLIVASSGGFEYMKFESNFPSNAKHNGLVKLVVFLSVFSKKVTALPSPIDAPC